MIPYGKQDVNQSDIDAVVDTLKSNFITQGPKTPFFEKKVINYCGAGYGVALNSATSALHVACLALGLGKGDWLWTSPNSFVASANCGLYCGAKVDFVDINLKTYNMSASELESKLIRAMKVGSLPKIVIPVHFAGQSCEMKKIHSLSREYGFKIIEDASHAIGGRYLNKPIGSCQYSDITVFSFHPVKIITTAEGGMAVTTSKELSDKMQLYRSHGITRNPDLMTKIPEGDWYYQQVDLGFNYRMNELQAALGISQMQRLDEFVARRHKLQKRYDLLLSESHIIKPYQDKNSHSALHLYPIQINLDRTRKSRQQIFDKLRQGNIGVNVHYIPIHNQPYFAQFGFKLGDFPNSEDYYNKTISIPLFSMMSISQQDSIINNVNKMFD